MSEIVRMVGVTKRFGSVIALSDVNLSVESERITGFIGPNGAGKTTLMRLMLGVVSPTAGRVTVLGEDPEKSRRILLKKIGALIEGPAYYGKLTAYENLEIVARMKKVSLRELGQILETVGLGKVAKSKVDTFSQGMKQRLGFALALVGSPELLILDEPTNGLDPLGIMEMRSLLLSLKEGRKVTILISSHILSELDRIVDDVVLVNRGSILYQGGLSDIQKDSEKSSLEDVYLSLLAQ